MRTNRDLTDWSASSLDGACDALLLSRLGRELAALYRDALQSPLPSTLQSLIDRLDEPSAQLTKAQPVETAPR